MGLIPKVPQKSFLFWAAAVALGVVVGYPWVRAKLIKKTGGVTDA